jgi:hypothetical protein
MPRLRHPFHLDPRSPPPTVLLHPCRQRWWDRTRRGRRHRRADDPRGQHDPRRTADEPRRPADDPRGNCRDTTTSPPSPPCPHCRQPVAIVAWLVPPAAATVAPPPRHAGETRDAP